MSPRECFTRPSILLNPPFTNWKLILTQNQTLCINPQHGPQLSPSDWLWGFFVSDQQPKPPHICHCGYLPTVISLIIPFPEASRYRKESLVKKPLNDCAVCEKGVCVCVCVCVENVFVHLWLCVFVCVCVIKDGVWNPKLKQDAWFAASVVVSEWNESPCQTVVVYG